MKIRSLVSQVNEILNSKLRPGLSKHQYRQKVLDNYIVSYSTLGTYKRECCNFVKWVKSNHIDVKIKTVTDCRRFAKEYLSRKKDDGSSYSAWTLKTERAAIAKMYGVPCRSICDLENRQRKNIVRSRCDSSMDKQFNVDNHSNAAMLGRAAGLRRSEFSRIRGKDVYFNADGELVVFIDRGKGNKSREAIVDPAYSSQVLLLASQTPSNARLIEKGKVPLHMDEHAYRREYAKSMLSLYSRDVSTLSRYEKYYCRGDAKGLVFDKAAMIKVSRSLGHNRLNVIAEHYVI